MIDLIDFMCIVESYLVLRCDSQLLFVFASHFERNNRRILIPLCLERAQGVENKLLD